MRRRIILLFICLLLAGSAHAGPSQQLIDAAMKEYPKVAHLVKREHAILVDFTLPASKPRLFIVNIKTRKVIYSLHTSHGIGSGGPLWAKKFSNKPRSYMSSLGVYITANRYIGGHGLSLKLKGYSKGQNTNAFKRYIVLHSAYYASKEFRKNQGRVGRSRGCFVIDPDVIKEIIELTEGGAFMFAYGGK